MSKPSQSVGRTCSLRKKTLVLRFCLLGLSLVVSFLYGVHHLLWLHDIDWDYKHAIFVTSFRAYDANHYLTQLKARDLYTELKTYRVDYLFYGPREKANFLVDPAKTYSFLREVYNDTVVKIYQIL